MPPGALDLRPESGLSDEARLEQLQHRARVFVEMFRPREALPLLQQWTDEELDSEEAWVLVAQSFHQLKDGERGVKAADLSIQASPYAAEGHVWKCRNLLAQDLTADAVRAARTGMDMTHGDSAVRRVLVETLLADKKIDEALQELAPLVAEAPEDPDVSFLQAETLRRRGYYDYAVPHYEAALFRDQDNAAAWAGLAALRKEQGHKEAAITCYYHAGRANPLNSEYRNEFVLLVDTLLEGKSELLLLRVAALLGFLFSGCIWLTVLPLLPLVLIAMFFVFRAITDYGVRSVLKSMLPAVLPYYKAVKPQVQKENAGWCAIGCGMLLGLIGIIWGIVELTRRGLWLTTLRIGLVSAVVIPWLWSKTAHLRPAKEQPVVFYFPEDDRPDGVVPRQRSVYDDPLNEAWNLLWQKKPQAAHELTRRALAVDPEDGTALAFHSLAEQALGRGEEAIMAAEQASAHDPEVPSFRALVWLHLALADRLDDVKAQALDAPDIVVDADEAIHQWVNTLHAAGTPQVRKKAAQMLAEIAPDTAVAQGLAGEWALEEERWTDAERNYRVALSQSPLNADYIFSLGIAVAQTKGRRDGWLLWNQAVRIDPTYEPAKSALNSLVTVGQAIAIGLATVLFAVLGFWPTLTGSTKNLWMPWVSFGGPVVMVLVAAIGGQIVKRRIAQALPAQIDWGECFLFGWALSLPLLLAVHAVQAWVEIALHPHLLGARWQGAATITFLVVCISAWFYESFWRELLSGWRKKPKDAETS